MNVLIADDDAISRLAIGRVLQRAGATAVTEVDNGLDALDRLETGRYDLLVLDLVMPAMDGYEVLQFVRASPDHRDLPVVVVSSVRDERGIADVIRLGICDYLSKPLRSDRTALRLTRAVQQAALVAADSGRRATSCLEPGRPLMIVDANVDFRQFFGSVMSPRNPVAEVPSGSQALKLCLEAPPSALFVGPDIGTLPPEALVRRLRQSGRAQHTTLVGAWPKAMLDDARHSGLFDEVIARTFVPKALLQQLNAVFAKGVAETLQAALKAMEPKVRSAVEQVFGMMLGRDLVASPGPLPDVPLAAASVDIERDTGDHLQFRILAPLEHAREFAGRLLLIDDATDDDALSGLAEVAGVISSRLQKALTDLGPAATCSAPQARRTEPGEGLAAPSPVCLVQWFAEDGGHVLFGVEIGAAAASDLSVPETQAEAHTHAEAQTGGAAA